MCGIVGVAGFIGLKEEKMFSDMLLLDSIRGKHSTGVAALHALKGEYTTSVTKDKLNAIDFMDLPEYKTVMGKVNRILLGHNRWATRGAIIKENAHPFEFDKIIGVHNGSLYSTYKLHDHTKYDVDSQALYAELNQNGVDEMYAKLDGAAALVWIDKETNQVNFLRNKERPLFYSYANEGRTLLWASEPWMIFVAAARQGVKCEEKVVDVPVNTLLTFTVPLTADQKEKVTVERREVKPLVKPAVSYGNWNGGYSNYESRGKKLLEKEGVDTGSSLFFTVDTIKDSVSSTGIAYATIKARTLGGTPVVIYNFMVDSKGNDDLVMKMWEEDDMVFRGRVSYGDAAAIVLSAWDIQCMDYTLTDLEEAAVIDEKEAQEEVKKPELKRIQYKISCSYCRTMVNAYYVSKPLGLQVCCEDCWNEELSQLTTTQRAALRTDSRTQQHLN